jgi:hypothetical protein
MDGGERRRWAHPGRWLLEPDELTELRSRDAVPHPSLRLYDRPIVLS